MLELAILGLLHESPMHGYELRKRLTTMLGAFRAAFSYGSLYPTLRRLAEQGWITGQEPDPDSPAPPLTGRRGKVVYKLTAEGKERFQELLAHAGSDTYDDANFGVHFAFFSRTDADTRLRILEGRRRRIEERRDGLRNVLSRAAERLDAYTLELQRHGLDAAEREVRWLNELIAHERAGAPPTVTIVGSDPTPSSPSPAPSGRPTPSEPQRSSSPQRTGRRSPDKETRSDRRAPGDEPERP